MFPLYAYTRNAINSDHNLSTAPAALIVLQLAAREEKLARLEHQKNSEHARKDVEIASRLEKIKDSEIRLQVC